MRRRRLHTILAFAHNQPGVLYKLLSLIRKKRYNVETITVGHTHVAGISRMTISFSREEGDKFEQIVKQIGKITEIPKTEDVTDADVVNRELVLLKVRAAPQDRVHVTATVQAFDGRVIHVAPAHMIVEMTGKQENVESTIKMFEDFGILGIARTGATVMHRGDEDMGLDRIVLPGVGGGSRGRAERPKRLGGCRPASHAAGPTSGAPREASRPSGVDQRGPIA